MFKKDPFKKIDEINYTYFSGVVKSLSAKLLRESTFEKIREATTFDEVLRILQDTYYFKFISLKWDIKDYEILIEKRKENFLKEAYNALPEPYVVEIFLLFEDFIVLKSLLKEKLERKTQSSTFIKDFKNYEVLKNIVYEKSHGEDISNIYEEAVKSAELAFSKFESFDLIDFFFDKFAIESAIKFSSIYSDSFIENYFRFLYRFFVFDFCIRKKIYLELEMSKHFIFDIPFSIFIKEYHSFNENDLERMLKNPLDNLETGVSFKDMDFLRPMFKVLKGIDLEVNYKEKMYELAKLKNLTLSLYLNQKLNEAFGPGFIFAYEVLLMEEFKKLRALLKYKWLNIKDEFITIYLKEAYV